MTLKVKEHVDSLFPKKETWMRVLGWDQDKFTSKSSNAQYCSTFIKKTAKRRRNKFKKDNMLKR